jgi:hypothetical protein
MVVALERACCEREGNFTGGAGIKKFKGLMVTIDGIDLGMQPLIHGAFSATRYAFQNGSTCPSMAGTELFRR